MKKEEVLAKLQEKKALALAAASAVVEEQSNELIDLVASIEVEAGEPSAELDAAKAQIEDLKAQLAALSAKEADEAAKLAQDELDLVALKEKLSKDEGALAQVKAVVDALLAPVF